MAAAIIDLRGDVLLAANWQPLCQDFHRRHPDAGALCRQSDVQLARRLEDGNRRVIYTCHHGLTDMASPIMVRGRHLANLFVGQVLLAPADIEAFSGPGQEVRF